MTRTANIIEPGSCEAPFPFDFDSAYRTDEYRGVGFYADGYEAEPVEPTWVWVCPGCGSPIWDNPEGHKLAKCWDCNLAFDTMFDTDEEAQEHGFWDDHEDETKATGRIVAHMIGDDRRFTFEPDELIRVDGPVCSCGQLGCGWHGEEL